MVDAGTKGTGYHLQVGSEKSNRLLQKLLNSKGMSTRLFALILLSLVIGVGLFFLGRRSQQPGPIPHSNPDTGREPSGQSPVAANNNTLANSARTDVYAHNLMLRKGPSFRIYVRWLRGQMVRARRNVSPSFDDPDSFYLDIETGVLRANIGDIGNFLNADASGKSSLKNIALSGDGNRIKITGTLKKVIPIPVEVAGEIAPLPDGRIQIHVVKINVLKIPFKGLLGGLHINVSDLFHSPDIDGLQVTGNDIYLDPLKLLPPPHIRGHLTAVRVVYPDLEEIYGNAQSEAERVEQWRNFLSLKGGSIDFGRLIMDPVDLIMIDISNDAWFDLDLAHYQKQLVYGYTRMTPSAALQIFMPDLPSIPQNPATQDIGIEWMRNRNIAPPKDVVRH
jgi:hypothetical protein